MLSRTIRSFSFSQFPLSSDLSIFRTDAGTSFTKLSEDSPLPKSSSGDDLPADLSYTAVTTMLRGELGFSGIAITDAQVMNTISGVYNSGAAAKMSVKAGIDMILSPEDLDAAANAVIGAVNSGEISEERINESVRRILTLKQRMGLLN